MEGTEPSEELPELSWELFLYDGLNGDKDSGCHRRGVKPESAEKR